MAKIKPKIKKTTLNTTFLVGIIVLILFVTLDLIKGNLTPSIVLKGIGGSLLGLVIGSIISAIKK